jgi:hypothetical protein
MTKTEKTEIESFTNRYNTVVNRTQIKKGETLYSLTKKLRGLQKESEHITRKIDKLRLGTTAKATHSKVMQEAERLRRMKTVRNFRFSRDKVWVDTTPLLCSADGEATRYLGKLSFSIEMFDSNIYNRIRFHSSDFDDPEHDPDDGDDDSYFAPHVFRPSGKICLGPSKVAVNQLIQKMELAAAVDIILHVIMFPNLNDEAGEEVFKRMPEYKPKKHPTISSAR